MSQFSHSVPLPDCDQTKDPGYARAKKRRSEHAILLQQAKSTKKAAQAYLDYVQVYQLPITLEDITSLKPNTAELEAICTSLEKKQPIPTSARIIDKNGRVLLDILAYRRFDSVKNPPVLPIEAIYDEVHSQKSLDEAKANGVKIVEDGLNARVVNHYQECLQEYMHYSQPEPEKYQRRHNPLLANDALQSRAEIMKTDTHTFAVLDGYAYRQDKKKKLPARADRTYTMHSMEYHKQEEDGSISRCFERCGVKRPVQAWAQQGQAKKGLYISSDISKTGDSIGSYLAFTENTRHVSTIIASYFEVLYPKEYAVLKPVFDAGRWVPADNSCFLGRAFVLKVPVALHHDGGDFSVTVTFPSGSYDGGHFLFPQLLLILKYAPGNVCFSISASLYHKITTWTPRMMNFGDGITPGRCSSVFFYPKETVRQLQDRTPGWGIREHYGRNGRTGERKLIPMKRVGEDVNGEPAFKKDSRKRHCKRRTYDV